MLSSARGGWAWWWGVLLLVACVPTDVCELGETVCADGCHDLRRDALNCGICGVRCPEGLSCREGRCTSADGCGDGVLAGEACDDGNATSGDGCSSGCQVETGFVCTGAPSDCVPRCGDGLVVGTERCDDGNVAPGDGCAPSCTTEPGFACTGSPSECVPALPEVEPNDVCTAATGPLTMPFTVFGAIDPVADQDVFAVTVPAWADVRLETSSGPSKCAGIDTLLTLRDSRCEVVATDDESGVDSCALLDPATNLGVRRLSPGTWYVQVSDFRDNTLISTYLLSARVTALCGDGVVEGSEQCDGTPDCEPDCRLIRVCGDDVLQGSETCDDGNLVSGDGCSASCELETVREQEPNDSTAAADLAELMLTNDVVLSAGIGTMADRDFYRLHVSAPAVLRLETFTRAPLDCRADATTLRLLDARGVELLADDGSGIADCAALTKAVVPGDYYAQVEQTGRSAVVPTYLLQARFLSQLAVEQEPNNTTSQATPLSGRELFVQGAHPTEFDVDVFALPVPKGRSLRAEVIESNNGETCESGEIDAKLTLLSPGGTVLAEDDDDGRGFCAMIDGTGELPRDPGAHALAGGTYFLMVRSSPFARDGAVRFDYRLVVTLR